MNVLMTLQIVKIQTLRIYERSNDITNCKDPDSKNIGTF